MWRTEGILGFQALWQDMEGRDGWAVIATFARRGATQKGIGSALMAATKEVGRPRRDHKQSTQRSAPTIPADLPITVGRVSLITTG